MIPRKKTRILAFIPLILWMSGCVKDNRLAGNYMTFDDIRYVNKFPQTFTLDSPVEVETDIIGIQDFLIYDSLLVLSATDREGLCSFLSLPGLHLMGKFLTIGNGPFEFFQPPWVNTMKFFKEEETLYAVIYNFMKGELYKMNIKESIQTQKLSIDKFNDLLPEFLFNFALIDSAYYFCKEINEKETQQIRYISKDGEKIIPAHFEKLNLTSIDEGEDFNILATITKINTERNLVVEMLVSLNYINLYSLDGSFGKTICVGKTLDDINKVQTKPQWSRKFIFSNPMLYSQFWGVIHWDISMLSYEMEGGKVSTIMFFDYEGEPLLEIKLKAFITSFDIDFANGELYTLNHQADAFLKYDIRDILNQFN
jgi:hypothetical protein